MKEAFDFVAGYGHEMSPDQARDDVKAATAAAEQKMHPQTVPVNVYGAPEALVVIAPFPAVKPDDVTIELRPGVLRITARLRSAGPREDLPWAANGWGAFERAANLAADRPIRPVPASARLSPMPDGMVFRYI